MIATTNSDVRIVTVANPNGLHLRSSASVAETASGYNARAIVCRGAQRADARSVVELLLLAAQQGAELNLEATGPDAEKLLDALAELF